MQWVKVSLKPKSSESRDYLETLYPQINKLTDSLDTYREKKFEQREKIFEIDLDSIEQYNIYNTTLPYTTIRQVMVEHALTWKTELHSNLSNGIPELPNPDVQVEYPVLYWSDYSISDQELHIKTNNNAIHSYSLSKSVGSDPALVRIDTENEIAEIGIKETGENKESQAFPNEELMNILLVHSRRYNGIRLNVQPNVEDELVNLFDILGLQWTDASGDLYYISSDPSTYSTIEEYSNKKSISVSEYYNLIGFPSDCGSRLDELTEYHDTLSGEEFVLYTVQDNIVSEEELPLVKFIPYYPETDVQSVRSAFDYAHQHRKQIESITESMSTVNGVSTDRVKSEYINALENPFSVVKCNSAAPSIPSGGFDW